MFKIDDEVFYRNANGEQIRGVIIGAGQSGLLVRLDIGEPKVTMTFTPDGREAPNEPVVLHSRNE